MEDPWAAGPSWTPPKPEQLDEAEQRGGIPSSFTPPPPSFDVSDPWGVQPTPTRLPGEEAVNRAAAREEDEDESGWGGGEATAGWGGMDTGRELETVDSPELSGLRIASPPHPEASEDDVQGGWGERSSLDSPIDEVPQPQELSEAAPASPFRAPSPDLALSPPVVASSPLASPPSFSSDLPSTPIPRSPSFGDDAFGGFSAGVAAGSDPWGANMDAEEGWGGGESSRHGSFDRNMQASQQEEDEGSDEGEGWGGVRAPRIMPQEQVERSDEDDWEEVQRRMRIQEERMPREKIEAMKNQWKEIVVGMITEKLEASSKDDEENLTNGVRKMQTEAGEALRSLAAIPPDINTYPPVISSLVTHERHVYALSRPNPVPSTSLLSISLNHRPRRIETLDTQSSWTTRSKLGEPDAPAPEAASSVEAQPKGWSFWKRPTMERQLTTSGGGILEVKSPTAPAFTRTSSDVKPPSKPASIIGNPSRPASPAPPATLSPALSMDDFGHPAPSGHIDSTSVLASQAPVPAPSAVSRFFGRLGRSKTPVATPGVDTDNKDLELSADDFHFLSEVPSLSDRNDTNVGDLLSLEPGRTEQIAGLQSVLTSKPTPLPAPLAPPPRGSAAVRAVSSSSGKFVAKMKQQAPTDMDLLGGLSFDDSSPSSPPPRPISKSPQPQPMAENSSSASMWDDFLAPSQAPSQPSKPPPSYVTQSSISSNTAFTSSPSSSPAVSNYHSSPFSAPLPPVPTPAQPPATTTTNLANPSDDDFGDFDFGTPQKASVAQFDDFDLSSFDAPMTQRAPAYSGTTPPPPKQTPLQSLVHDASATKGRRWPAPASPIAPILEPPPRATPGGGAFPFLSPPPPSSKPSRQGTPVSGVMNLLGESNTAEIGTPTTVAPVPPPASALMSPSTPRGLGDLANMGGVISTQPKTGSPLVPASTGQNTGPTVTGASQGGLSASDLSFFDSL